jgi:hypothetical protein
MKTCPVSITGEVGGFQSSCAGTVDPCDLLSINSATDN